MENIMQKTLTPQHPSENDGSATCSLPTISICWKAAMKNSNNSLKDWRKQLLDAALKSTSTLAKFSATVFTNVRMKGKPLEEVDQFKYLEEGKARLTQEHAMLWKNHHPKAISFPQRLTN